MGEDRNSPQEGLGRPDRRKGAVKRRVLFLLADLETGGAQRVILTVLRHLDRKRFDPRLGVIRAAGPLAGEIPGDVPVHDLKSGRVRYALPDIVGLCRSLRPEAVLSTLGHLNLALLLGKPFLPRGTRVIVREANTPSIRLRYTRHPLLYRALYRMLYPFADRVVCNSEYMRSDMERDLGLKPGKAVVISNPVDLKNIDRAAGEGGSPYSATETHFVSVGRLNYQKGFDLLLRAFGRALKERPDLHLTIVGDGPEAGPLKDLSEELGLSKSVTFAGRRDNPFPFLAHADLVISSSRWEGSPNVVLEALACGTPVLAFDCPGGTGEIIRNGENGWLVRSQDWEEMGEKMAELGGRGKALKSLSGDLLPARFLCGNVIDRYEDLLMNTRTHSGKEWNRND